MPRKARQYSSSGFYHVVIKGLDCLSIFESTSDYYKYLDLLKTYKIKCEFDIFAYCLMSNHVHLIIRSSNYNFSLIFQRLNTHYASWFNMKYSRTGHLQDGRFFSEPIEDIEYLWQAIRYVHHNPLKAGLESHPGEKYVWSSIHEYMSTDSSEGLIDKQLVFDIFPKDDFLNYNLTLTNEECLDIDKVRRSIPDDVAKEIIKNECNCSTSTEFQNLPLVQRDKYLVLLKKMGLSIRQLNRLTGIPRGIIQRTSYAYVKSE